VIEAQKEICARDGLRLFGRAMMTGFLARDMRRHWTMLAAIVVAASVLRVVALDAYGLWNDEALTIVLSNWSIPDMFLLPTDPTPPLYYVLHKLLIPANASVEVVRSISVAAGVMSVGLIYVLGRLAFGATGGLLAAALLAVWTMHVDYSQEARAYSLLFFLSLLTSVGVLSYACALQRTAKPCKSEAARRRVALVLFGVGNVLSFYTHIIATAWIVLSSLLLLAIVVRERRIHRAELLSVFGVMAVCASPGIYRLIQQMLVGDDFHWLPQAGLVDFAATTASVLLPVGLWVNPLADALGTGRVVQGAVAAGSVVLLGTGLWFGRQKLHGLLQERSVVLWLILAYLAVPILTWMFGFVARPLFMDRVILFSVPGMILLITASCFGLGKRLAAGAAIAAVLLYGASTLLFGIMREKEDWRGADRFLAASASPTDVIAVCPLYNYPALRYHAGAPVGSAVLALSADGSFVQIERGLGTNPEWDKTFHRTVSVPRMAGQRVGAQVVPTALRLQPGQSIWRVDGHCNSDFSAAMDAALHPLAPDPDIAWIQNRKGPQIWGIVIRRYRVNVPVALDIRYLGPRRNAPSFGRVASAP
jgi:hypothetical protein